MKNFIKNIVERVITNKKGYVITEVKYFSTDGRKTIPNGHPIQKGGFIRECELNKRKFKSNNYQYLITENFKIVEGIHDEQYGLFDYRGGIITFSTDINSVELSKNKIYNWLLKKGTTLLNRFFSKSKLSNIIRNFNDTEDKQLGGENIEDYIGAFSIGNFFSGRYLDDKGKVYDEKSLSIEVNGISSKGLIFLAEEIAREFKQETVLVKDLNLNKIFLVDQSISNDYDLSKINSKNF
jgi:hypothetical protein